MKALLDPNVTKSGIVNEFACFLTLKPGTADACARAALGYVNLPGRSGQVGREGVLSTGIHDLRLTVFDNGTRLYFGTSFDTDWDSYIDDSLTAMGGAHPWGQFLQYTNEAPAGIEVPGKIPNSATKAFLATHRVHAAAYDNTFPQMGVHDLEKASRLLKAFETVLNDPRAAEALSHPALKPLLEEASS